MSSQPRTDSNGSKARHPVPGPAPSGSSVERRARIAPVNPEDVLAQPVSTTDDTPTIISKKTPGPPPSGEHEAAGSIRGRRLAHFELIEPIGVGGMAAVLRARDTQLDRLVALKILPPEMAGDPENVRRFHQEARSAAKLDHENIARVFFCGEDQRLHFIAFEFVEGENLRNVLVRRGRLPVNEALHYLLQVAAGLAHAAQRGVVHRDIKPSNIIITPSGRAKLVDMGLARSLDRSAHPDNDLTQSGVTLGTFDYISPEQALEPREADVRSDIYSLGCTFYHVLTGRPPVAEGTAARKLHCHQHVKPPDPRQYVPDLPLEVVQVLDRMMAKNPRDRFQTPEELVQRLLQAARTLGINPEVPEGVLSFEATVPVTPASRSLLWVAAAAVAVVLLVIFLDPLGTTPAPTTVVGGNGNSSPPENGDGKPAEKDSPRVGKGARPDQGTSKPPGVTPASDVYTAPDQPYVAELMQWVEQKHDAASIELRLAGELDLSSRNNAAAQFLLLQARKVIIRPRDADARPVIRLRYDGLKQKGQTAALTILAQHSEIEGVRFIIDGREAPDTPMAALALHPRGGTHTIRRCEFIQEGTPGLPAEDRAEESRMASLVVAGGRSSRAVVNLRECVFLGFKELGKAERDGKEEADRSGAGTGGQDAVVRRGSVQLHVESCAFGPHVAAFRLEGGENSEDGRLTVRSCSVLLPGRRGAGFDLPAGAAARLEVSSCLFSRLGGEDATGDGAVLIRQAEDSNKAVTYQGKDNCYHDLDGYWAVGKDWQKAGWRDFRDRALDNGQDASRVVLRRPWLAGPAELEKRLAELKPIQAFQLDPRLPSLRKQGGPKTHLVGAEVLLGEALRDRDERLPEAAEKGGRFLMVEPGADDGAPRGIYPDLSTAIAQSLPGDTILLRHAGELKVPPILLDKTTLADLTIRPARGFRPILKLGETSETETALFRVQDGKLRLENLEVRLKVTKPEFRRLTVAALAGNGMCLLRRCLVTLERLGETESGVVLALASLNETGKVMRLDMQPARKPEDGPLLVLERCFVRGDGDLLACQTGRPCELRLEECLAALSGSLLNVKLPADPPEAGSGHKVKVSLKKSTTYLGGHLVRLACGKAPRGLAPVRCQAANCLFVAQSPSRALVHLEGSSAEGVKLADRFSWEGSQNAYSGYTQMQQVQNPGGEEMPAFMNWDQWKRQYVEDGTTGVKLANPIPSEARFPELKASLFAPSGDVPDSGVKPSRLP